MTEMAPPHGTPQGSTGADELASLLAWLANRRDDERRLMARQLHDNLGSSMTALSMHLSLLARQLPPGENALNDRCGQMKTLLATIIEANRAMQQALWNDKLEFLGLDAALKERVPAFGAERGVCARLSLPHEPAAYSQPQAALLLACVEAGLANAVDHGRATDILVLLDDDGQSTLLTIRDDGCVALKDDALQAGHTLRVLRERARHAGGELTLSALPEGGAMLQMTLPHEALA